MSSFACINNNRNEDNGNSNVNNYSKRNQNGYKFRPVYMNLPCSECGKYRNWNNSHNSDGSIPENVKQADNSPKETRGSSKNIIGKNNAESDSNDDTLIVLLVERM